MFKLYNSYISKFQSKVVLLTASGDLLHMLTHCLIVNCQVMSINMMEGDFTTTLQQLTTPDPDYYKLQNLYIDCPKGQVRTRDSWLVTQTETRMVHQMNNQIISIRFRLTMTSQVKSLQVSTNRLWAFDSTMFTCGTEKLGGTDTSTSNGNATATATTIKFIFHGNWQLTSQPHELRARAHSPMSILLSHFKLSPTAHVTHVL